MGLSEININDVVLYQTNAVIGESNYQTLRQHLLERKAILSVTNGINLFLGDNCTQDKQAFMNHFTQLACEAQRISDIQDALQDELEKKNETAFISKYALEKPLLESQLIQLDMKCFHQQNIYNQACNQLSELKINLERINESLDRVQHERRVLNSQVVFNPPYSAYPGAYNVYGHYAAPQVSHYHPEPYVAYVQQDSYSLNSKIQEENRLLDERRRLKHLIEAKITESNREELNLNKLNQEKKQIEASCNKIKRQIDTEFPANEIKREIRREERHSRENARHTYDPNLQQLSQRNHKLLKEQIASKNNELDRTREELMSTAINTGYSLYITQLGQVLQQPQGLLINFNEREALKLILSTMKKCFEMEEEEKTATEKLINEKRKLASLQKKLAENTAELKGFMDSKPEYINRNKELGDENSQLKINSNTARSHRQKALFASLFGGSVSIVSGVLVFTLMISPLFWAIPAVLALLTIASLIVATVYHFKKSAIDNQLDQNQTIIHCNEESIFEESKIMDGLSATTIPSLNTQIVESEKAILLFTAEAQENQNAIKQLLGKAQNVNSNYYGVDLLFCSQSTQDAVFMPTPSAPPQYESEDFVSYPTF